MHRHRYFDLYLHDDDELASLLRSPILERVTLHEWPLSCVQRLMTFNGRKVIYKTQFGPTVESEFYANARSPLLVSAETIYRANGHACMLIEFVEAPLLEELDLSGQKAVQMGRAIMEEMRGIAGALPYYVDVSTKQQWVKFARDTLKTLGELVDQARLNLVDRGTIRSLERWACSDAVLSAVRKDPGYVHGDFGGDNVLVLPDGYRVIDWQRPKLGPTDLDLATLLESLDFDPSGYVDQAVVGVMYFLRIQWATQCAVRWIPEGIRGYDEGIARLAALIGDLAKP